MIIGNPITLGGGGGAKGQPLSSLTEGSLVSVLEDGKLTPFYVAKHDYESDLNGAGRTLLVRENLYDTRAWDTGNVNAYATSDIDAWLNGDYKNLLSNTVKAQMGVTSLIYTVGNENATVSTLQRSVFLLSVTELGFAKTNVNVEGETLPIASALHIAHLNGTATRWWTRSPYSPASDGRIACMLLESGTADQDYVTNTYGARPCFTLPATMKLNEVPNADGSWTLADEVTIDTETATTTAKSGVTYTNGIADLTPAQLHEIAAAISANPNIDKYMGTIYYDKGDVHRKISTGDTQDIDINGTTYSVNIIGFNHDDLALGTAYGEPTATGKAGMSFQLVNCLSTGYAMNSSDTNAGGWTSCVMRVTNMTTFLSQLSAELQGILKSVNKLTSAGSRSSTINTTADKLFLLSEIEIFGSLTHSFAGEGSQYAYYKAGNSRVKNFHAGNTTTWWGRSPANDAISFCNINTTGAAAGTNGGARAPIGVAFAYCI